MKREFQALFCEKPEVQSLRLTLPICARLHHSGDLCQSCQCATHSYRTIAEALLGFHGTKTDWEGDPRKNKARRLVASGQRMMRGGYRTLLHYPIKLPRR